MIDRIANAWVAPLAGSVDRNTVCRSFCAALAVAPLAGSVDRNSLHRKNIRVPLRSLPSRGAWIEILRGKAAQAVQLVAPLAGSVDRNGGIYIDPTFERNVAPLAGSVDRNPTGTSRPGGAAASLPSRGAWIEIALCDASNLVPGSLPSRGAWIEIPDSRLQRSEYLGRSPRGERG